MIKLMMWDLRMLARSRMAVASVGAWMLCLAAAMYFGQQRAHEYQAAARSVRVEFATRQKKLENDIRRGDRFAVMPLSANGLVVLPSAPLLDIVAGRSDLEPMTSEVNMWTLTHLMFLNHQTGNATTSALGRFDTAFSVLYVMPLLLIVLGHSVLTSERETGQERMLQGYGVDLTRLMRAQLAVRGLIVLLPLALVLLLAHLQSPFEHAERGVRLLALAVISFLYAAFWLALAAWVCARASSARRALQYLIAAWVVLTLILPAAVAAWARVAYPAPSRFDLLADARRTEIESTRERDRLIAAYATDHPNLAVNDSETTPLWQKGVIVVTGSVETALAPVRDRFDEQLVRQQELTEQLQYLTPVLVAQRAMVKVAGTDESRYVHLKRGAAEYLKSLRAAIGEMAMMGQALTAERLWALPQHRPVERTFRSNLSSIAYPTGFWTLIVALMLYLSRAKPAR